MGFTSTVSGIEPYNNADPQHGPDGLSNISVTHPQFNPPARKPDDIHEYLDISDKSACHNILELLRAEPADTVSIVALGPCEFLTIRVILPCPCDELIPVTNIAHALRQDPQTFARIHTLIWMGGALDVPGNTAPTAEFNCFADPYAAEQVIAAVKTGMFDMVMAPLDITTPHQIPFGDLIHPSYPSNPDPSIPPLQQLVSSMLGRVRGIHESFGIHDAMEMHDPLAVWYAMAHAGLGVGELADGWGAQKRDFIVERKGEHTRGMCVVDRRGTGEVGEDRTKSEALKAQDVERAEQDKADARQLPRVIIKTPGSEALRKDLLYRVFGKK